MTPLHSPFSALSLLVKICGVMQPEHACVAAEAGADMLGMVFAPSRRQVGIEAARRIREALAEERNMPLLVGVFVNESTDCMLDVAAEVGLGVLQLSGDETPEQVAECARYYPIIKAVRFPTDIPHEQDLHALRPYVAGDLSGRVRLLLDTYRPGEYGGTGKRADWRLAAALARRLPLILAGGLHPGNVGQAVEVVRPFGIDVSSGVERDGVKDGKLIRDFIGAARLVAAA